MAVNAALNLIIWYSMWVMQIIPSTVSRNITTLEGLRINPAFFAFLHELFMIHFKIYLQSDILCVGFESARGDTFRCKSSWTWPIWWGKSFFKHFNDFKCAQRKICSSKYYLDLDENAEIHSWFFVFGFVLFLSFCF